MLLIVVTAVPPIPSENVRVMIAVGTDALGRAVMVKFSFIDNPVLLENMSDGLSDDMENDTGSPSGSTTPLTRLVIVVSSRIIAGMVVDTNQRWVRIERY